MDQGRKSVWLKRIAAVATLLLVVSVRLIRLDQPIVENYVGRQIPTAMAARNLERGSGFLKPQLDTGPFPNWFLVEPPIFELATVCAHRVTGLPLESAGRLVSSLGISLACWGLWRLAKPRIGFTGGLAAAFSLGVFPVCVRYGRAFQPDALMLGFVVAGLWFCDESKRRQSRSGWRPVGSFSPRAPRSRSIRRPLDCSPSLSS